ncbi:MAG: hypothetical protein KatS3mg111_0762 [Pirellulaceae bacterium]|nr:MAG: hypothetical protein KatS3mg111_0762 [Pirellulaceae bacterium]
MSTSTKQTQTPAPHRAASDSMAARSPVESVRVDRPHAASDVDARATNEPASGDGTETSVLLTVLMPCLNESRTLTACIAEAHQACRAAGLRDVLAANAQELGANAKKGSEHEAEPRSADVDPPSEMPAYEILIADNGSTDDSVAVAEAAGARVVHVEEKGYGAALRGGIAAARGKYVVMADSDCSYNFGDIPRFLAKLQQGFDLVVGNRFAGGIEPGAMPWHHRWIGNPVLSGLGRLLYRTPIRDWHCGLRAFDRQKILGLGLGSSGMEFASEMILRASQARLAMAELPTTLRPDCRDRRPHLRSMRDGLRHLRLLGQAKIANKPKIQQSLGHRLTQKRWRLYSMTLLPMVAICLFALLSSRENGAKVEFSRPLDLTESRKHGHVRTRPAGFDGVTSYDFGLVLCGTRPEHEFRLTNRTGRELQIAGVRSSCSCTVASISREIWLPDDELRVRVQYKSPSVLADDFQKVELHFADPLLAPLALRVAAKVRPLLAIVPQQFPEIACSRGEQLTHRFEIKNFGSQLIDDIEVISPSAVVTGVDLKPVNPPSKNDLARQKWRVAVHMNFANISFGSHQVPIDILPKNGTPLKTNIPIYVRSPISVVPSQFFFGRMDDSSSKGKSVSIRVLFNGARCPLEPDALTIEKVPGIQFLVTRIKDIGWEVTATIVSKPSPSSLSTKIRLRLNGGEVIEENVPIRIYQ